MKTKQFLLIIAAMSSIVLVSCKQTNTTTKEANKEANNDHLIMSILYQQRAAEYEAMCYQSYNLAKQIVDQKLKANPKAKNLAIITDIDETVLDNSPYEAALVIKKYVFPDKWKEWTSLANAKPIPGSLDFFNYAASKGVTIFYITNRDTDEKHATIENLKKLNFPFADSVHVMTRDSISSKEIRRNKVRENYDVILYIGDNLADFNDSYLKTSMDYRHQTALEQKDSFGSIYIVLPNAMYGEWESAMYNFNYNQNTDSIRRSLLITF
ncbi:MAG: 5'-nucleotidase, lipoprotein e(P4) family [Bacteroidales bacterium]|nr:5'-nucleotidase, lipoprotein e(P4) family [Bacteroidales bacterium]